MNTQNAVVLFAVIIEELFLLKTDVLEAQIAVFSAMRTFNMPFFLRASLICFLDFAHPLDGRGRCFHHLSVMPERLGAALGKLNGITLCSGTDRESVCFVEKNIPNWLRGQSGRAVCSDDGKTATGEGFHGNGIGCIASFSFMNFLAQ